MRFATMILAAAAVAALHPQTPTADQGKDNAELARMYKEDQADRNVPDGRQIDWNTVGPHDRARVKRIKEMLAANEMRTGDDYYSGAMVLQHAPQASDYLLAHEMCVVALAKGNKDAAWLAAASEDRYLMTEKLPQRFGTQYRADNLVDKPTLWKVEDGVTDAMRVALGAPTLAAARARKW